MRARVHALECACMCHSMGGRPRTTWAVSSPFTTWAPGIELMPAGLAASILTHRAISAASVSLPFVGTASLEALSPAQVRRELVMLGSLVFLGGRVDKSL